jgi:predicted RNase H-like HicB family nuclease
MILNAVIEKDEFGYFAQIPELKGCVTQGNTYEEALLNIQEAAERGNVRLKQGRRRMR